MRGTQRSRAACASLLLRLALPLLPACASLREQPGFEGVEELTAKQGAGDLAWPQSAEARVAVDTQARSLLGPELGVDDAVRISLLRNPSLQATYERLGFAEADLVEAGLLQNPVFAGAFMPGVGSLAGSRNVEVQLSQNLLQILLLPSRKRIEAQRFEGVQLDVAARVLDLAAQTRHAWYTLVAQRNLVATLRVLEEAADAVAELAKRFHAAGNLSDLELSRELGLAEDARLLRLEAEAGLAAPREALARLLGARVDDGDWNVPERLPAIPAADPDFAPDAPDALAGRLDLTAARRFSVALGEATALQRRWRFVPFVEAGVAANSEPGEGWTVGPALVLELPIFQQGQPALGRLESALRQSEREIEALELDARAAAREAIAQLASARNLAERYREVTIPLRQKTTSEALRHYNFMLIGIFEVVAAKKDEISAYAGYIGAVREWWKAFADLSRATGLDFAAGSPGPAPVVEGVTPSQGAADPHAGHAMPEINPGTAMPAEEPVPAPADGGEATGHPAGHGGH